MMRLQPPVLALSSAALLLSACAHGPPDPACDYALNRHDERCSEALRQGDLDTAESACALALEFNPHSADLWTRRGLIALQRQDTRQAKRHFVQALRYDADHPQARMHLRALGSDAGAPAPAP